VEHTADRALRVWGEELVDLFVGAARGMCGLMARVEEAGTPLLKWHEVSLESLDREGLLVDWLNELLYLTEVEGLIFCDFRIRSLSDTHLVARIGGAPGEVTGAHIKAATFHDLEIEPADGGWATVITFDV
ncbi:MAG: archease, partial [Anaerolineae bacterium]|jgi:SHS2 domain-containing protein